MIEPFRLTMEGKGRLQRSFQLVSASEAEPESVFILEKQEATKVPSKFSTYDSSDRCLK